MIKNKAILTIFIVATFICFFAIFCFSNENYQSSHTLSNCVQTNIIDFSNRFGFKSTAITFFANHNIRKCAHVILYFILGLFVCFTTQFFAIQYKSRCIISILICAVYSISDEYHQLFSSGRTSSIRDVTIDVVAASLGIGASLTIQIICKKIQKKLVSR